MIHKKNVLLFLIFSFLVACSPEPKEYLDKAFLNSNLIRAYYTPRFFEETLALKSKNQLTVLRQKTPIPVTASEYFKDRIPDLSLNISKIKSLKKDDDTKEMLEASLAYFQQADDILKNEYSKISKMMDENKPQAEIEAEIVKIFEKYDAEMIAKHERLGKAAAVYAKKNNINLINIE